MPPTVRCTWTPSINVTSHSPRLHSVRRKAQTRTIHQYSSYLNQQPYRRTAHQRSCIAPIAHQRAFSASTRHHATKDPYKVLGVSKNSSASEIKKAYYTLAKKYHPDTNKDSNAKERFADAQSAYELLQDPKKKQTWDQYGAAAFDQDGGFDPRGASAGQAGGNPFAGAGGPFEGFGGGFGAEFNFEDLFGAFTGQGRRARPGGGGGQGRQSSSPFEAEEVMVGENIEVQTNISFMDAAKGVSKDIHITPLVTCDTCNGNGMKKGTQRQSCAVCKGTGTKVHFMQQGFQMASTCDACGGQGVSIPRGSECRTCKGNGVVRQRKSVHVDIPGGVEDGMRLRLSGEGDAAPTGMAGSQSAKSTKGDLYVFIRVAPDSRFSRNGADVLYTATIPLTTALLGGEVMVPTLDGEVKVKVATGTGTGDRVTLGGMGMRRLGSGRRAGSGDLKVEFKIGMPKYLSANQRTILEMLADEMGDKTAKRVMNLSQYQQKSNESSNSSPSSSSSSSSDSSPFSGKASAHKNEGFLKSAWHRLTNQHANLEPDTPTPGSAQSTPSGTTSQSQDQEEPPKKASGSG